MGAEYVGFGSDYVHDIEGAKALIASNKAAFPAEMGYGELAPKVAVPGVIWGVVRVLQEKYDWSEKEIRGFLGANAMRVYQANWQV